MADKVVRDEIKNLSGFNSDEQLESWLPESTVREAPLPDMTSAAQTEYTPTGRIKKPRKKKDETEIDKRKERFKERATGLGGKSIIVTGFEMTDKPLDTDEDEELGDFFYVLSQKANIDPSENWILMGLYFVFMLARFTISRTSLGDDIKKFLSPKTEEEKQTEENEKARQTANDSQEEDKLQTFNIEQEEKEMFNLS